MGSTLPMTSYNVLSAGRGEAQREKSVNQPAPCFLVNLKWPKNNNNTHLILHYNDQLKNKLMNILIQVSLYSSSRVGLP